MGYRSRDEQADPPRISQEALDRLCHHTWPGNIDELHSVLKRSLIEAKGNVILSDALQDAISRDPVLQDAPAPGQRGTTDWAMFVDLRVDAGASDLYSEAVAEMERKVLSHVLRHTAGNQAQASKILGITRTSLRKKLRLLGINVQHVVQMDEVDASAG
jgi:two-component system nitrogen regulation response regulator GlnG